MARAAIRGAGGEPGRRPALRSAMTQTPGPRVERPDAILGGSSNARTDRAGRIAAGAAPSNPPLDLDAKASPPSGTLPPGRRPASALSDGQPDPESTRPDPDEQEIVQRARNGDGEAFRRLVERTQDRTFRFAMRLLRCDSATAEDLCQEIYLRAYRGLPRFDGMVRFSIWLHTITMNACISEYRRRRTQKRAAHRTLSLDAPVSAGSDLHLDPPSREADPSARAVDGEFADAVRRAVAELPDEFRDAVILRDLQDLSYEEIGGILAVPAGTVRSRIHRGRLLLQDILREHR